MTRRNTLFDKEFLDRLQRLHLIAKRLAGRGTFGQRRSLGLGDGLELADHRPYAPGDDMRYVDWPYYGRMEKLLLRLFHEHSEAAVTILLDRSGSMRLGQGISKFDYARRAAGALAYVAMGGLDRVRIAPFADRLDPPLNAGRNRRNIFGVLDYLLDLTAGGETGLAEAVTDLSRRHVTSGDTVVLISDLLGCGDGLSTAVRQLAAAGAETVVVQVVSPADASPPASGEVLLQDAETSRRLQVNVTDYMKESYRSQWDSFYSACLTSCAARAIHIPARTDQPLDRLILHALGRAGLVR